MQFSIITKRILAIIFVIFAYILLTSSIIDYRSQQKMTEAIISSTLRIGEARFSHQATVTETEKAKSNPEINNELASRLSGRLLIQTQTKGQLWYINPIDNKRYYLGKENEAFRFIQKVAVSTSSEQVLSYEFFDKKYPSSLGGYFLSGLSQDYCYIDPRFLNSHCFNNVEEAYKTIKERALGVSNDDLRSIEVGDPFKPAIN